MVALFRAKHTLAEIVRQTGVGRLRLPRAGSSRTACAGKLVLLGFIPRTTEASARSILDVPS